MALIDRLAYVPPTEKTAPRHKAITLVYQDVFDFSEVRLNQLIHNCDWATAFTEIRENAIKMANALDVNCPGCAERTLAERAIEKFRMYANRYVVDIRENHATRTPDFHAGMRTSIIEFEMWANASIALNQ